MEAWSSVAGSHRSALFSMGSILPREAHLEDGLPESTLEGGSLCDPSMWINRSNAAGTPSISETRGILE
jgi:hypothetical protein